MFGGYKKNDGMLLGYSVANGTEREKTVLRRFQIKGLQPDRSPKKV